MFNVRKSFGAALLAVSGLMISLGLNFTSANAETASTDTSVVTEELCTWYMLGAPSTIALTPAVPGTEYEGDLIEVSASFEAADEEELNVYSSGNVTAGSRNTFGSCTFYSAATRPTVTMSISDADFTASASTGGADAGMDFEASAGNEFQVDQTSTCDVKWSTADINLKTGSLSASPMSINTLSDVDARVTSDNDRCTADLTISIDIPGGKTPAYPGETYSWSGPSFTTSLSTSNS